MKFSTRTTYGLRAMVKLGQGYGQGSMPLSMIAREEKISRPYLERLFASLKKDGLVTAEKGASGGYQLAQSPKSILVYDIVRSLEGKMSPFHCIDEKGKVFCSDKCRCGATRVLVEVQKAVNKTLSGMTLSELL